MGRQGLALVMFAVITAAAAAMGMRFRPGAWYEALAKPGWTPPNVVFPMVWTVLYVMIALAGWLAWRKHGSERAVVWWLIAIVFNGLWSYLFFGLHRPDAALIDIALLLVAIVGFIRAARQVSVGAAMLFVPYLLWVGYAATLNAGVWMGN